jgi:hypothetical protein
MKPIRIPKGFMCAVCVHRDRVCNHLRFDEMIPMGKPDKEGYQEVKCEEFVKEGG